ncbi:hypothetical protein DYB32_001550 [Aphanomyces invadans]|uniref:Uncharacterized protein n=1 Tax=Aphanomyces invadans TaxID=157072 RepID=A0A3R6Z3Z6_9STRA|nr:hypothetical protein DYB32_001550 [Aphanomyces invadans]
MVSDGEYALTGSDDGGVYIWQLNEGDSNVLKACTVSIPHSNKSAVTALIQDFEDLKEVNAQLEVMGYGIGIRLIDEFLAKSGVTACADFKDTTEVVAKVAFKMFFGINVDVVPTDTANVFHLILYENPLSEFVELPPHAHGVLSYSNILCGVLRGALEMVLDTTLKQVLPMQVGSNARRSQVF